MKKKPDFEIQKYYIRDLTSQELLKQMKMCLLTFRQQAYHFGLVMSSEYGEDWPDDITALCDDITGPNSYDDKIVRIIANIEQILTEKYLS
jgi:hypothetical protein